MEKEMKSRSCYFVSREEAVTNDKLIVIAKT